MSYPCQGERAVLVEDLETVCIAIGMPISTNPWERGKVTPKTNYNSHVVSNLSSGSLFAGNEMVYVCAYICVGSHAEAWL